MKKAQRFLILAAVGVFLFSAGGSKAYAQSTKTKPTVLPTQGQGNGLRISPVNVPLTIEKGGTRRVTITLENITASNLQVGGFKNDFVAASDESGEPRIILDDDKNAPVNSFKQLVGPLPTLSLKPGERKDVSVTLTVPKDAAAGGYYGAIRFAPVNGKNDKNVSLQASVGTIYLIRVPGEIKEQLKVEEFTAKHNATTGGLFSSGPIDIVVRFRNFGNVHVQPFGKISVKGFKGEVLYETEINNTQPRGSVLPDSIRKFVIPVKTDKKWFGRYVAEGSFGYGSNGELIQARKVFYVIPFKLIAGVIFGLALLIFALPRAIRAYNRSVIRHAGGQTSPQAKPKAAAGTGSRTRKK